MGPQFFVYGSNKSELGQVTYPAALNKDKDLLEHAYVLVTSVHWYVDTRKRVGVVYTADAVATGFLFYMLSGYRHTHILASLFEIPSLVDDLLGVAVRLGE